MQQREKGTGKVVERRSTAENQFVNPNLCAHHFKTVGLGYATRLKVQFGTDFTTHKTSPKLSSETSHRIIGICTSRANSAISVAQPTFGQSIKKGMLRSLRKTAKSRKGAILGSHPCQWGKKRNSLKPCCSLLSTSSNIPRYWSGFKVATGSKSPPLSLATCTAKSLPVRAS